MIRCFFNVDSQTQNWGKSQSFTPIDARDSNTIGRHYAFFKHMFLTKWASVPGKNPKKLKIIIA